MDYMRPLLSENGVGSACLAMDKAFRVRTEWNFGQLVQSRYQTQVTNPRDYFFSLLGVASDALAVIEEVKVDYAQDARDVYIAAARFLLRNLKLSELMKYNNHLSSPSHCLPSWVPDWGVPIDLAPKSGFLSGNESLASDETEMNLSDILIVRRRNELKIIEKLSDILPQPEDYPQSTKTMVLNRQHSLLTTEGRYTKEYLQEIMTVWQAFLDRVTDPGMPRVSSQTMDNDLEPEQPCFAGAVEWAPIIRQGINAVATMMEHYMDPKAWNPQERHRAAPNAAKLGDGNFAIVPGDVRVGNAIMTLSHSEHVLHNYAFDSHVLYSCIVRPLAPSQGCSAELPRSRLHAITRRWNDADASKLTHCVLTPGLILWAETMSARNPAYGYVALH
jgi:hypothetical protein